MTLETVRLKKIHYLIIDDSEMIRTQFSRAISRICEENSYSYQIFEIGRQGQFSAQAQKDFDNTTEMYYAYTAATYKQALKVLEMPDLNEMTLVCDLSIPSDTEVGVVGFLEALARLRLPVNLIFMSGDYQNRASIESLLKRGKAFFIEKGTAQWNSLPSALIKRVSSFQYQCVTVEDFTVRSRSMAAPAFLEQLVQATLHARTAEPEAAASATPEPTAAQPAETLVKTEELPAEVAAKPHLVAKLVSSVKELPGRAGSLGSSGGAKIREIPDLLKKAPLPQIGIVGRRKRDV